MLTITGFENNVTKYGAQKEICEISESIFFTNQSK